MTASELRFRIATVDDAPQIQSLIQSAFRAEDSRKGWTADMALNSRFTMDVEEVLANIRKPDNAVLVATDDSGTFVASFQVVKRSADLARFAMFAVDQHHQRRGLGRRALAYGEEYCQREWGVKKMDLSALSTRLELIAWYERCGYRKTGETAPFTKDHVKGLDLPDDLCFVVLDKDLRVETVANVEIES